MPATVAESTLDANLAALGSLNDDVRSAIAAAEPAALELIESDEGVPSANYGGKLLASRRRPLSEANRFVADINLVEHAVVVVFGFGLGYHVQKLAERMGRAGVIIVVEPDVALLRAALEVVDHASWLHNALVVWLIDPHDSSTLSWKLQGAEALLVQGVHFLEHPASMQRLQHAAGPFSAKFRDYITTAKTNLMTTLMRAIDTSRNCLFNLPHYAGNPGVTDLHNCAKGFPAVIVSAGPSLHRNMHILAQDGVRDRCVIIAVQTTLKPLLEAGIKPHFVTALDFHEISRRFYEGIDPQHLQDVTLVAEPKANSVILDLYPGPVRCCRAAFLDLLLGDLKRDMGELPAGSTVAHLAFYLAHYLGCDPIVMIGQDLGFPHGLYYAPGAAIHDVWAPELNPFNTLAMMEWQRIARYRAHLHKIEDIDGRTIFTDTQMLTYLQQFERDFAPIARSGVRIIDATEGGVLKQHTIIQPLQDVIDEHATRPLPTLPIGSTELDASRCKAAADRVRDVRDDIQRLQATSRKTVKLIEKMLQDQHQPERMDRHFEEMQRLRDDVQSRFTSFELLNYLNQFGAFKRLKADRALQMKTDLTEIERQRAELERDSINVTWLIDAADEMARQLEQAEQRLRRDGPRRRSPQLEAPWPHSTVQNSTTNADVRIAALIPIDPQRSGSGIQRAAGELPAFHRTLQQTLERLGQSHSLDSLILIVPNDCSIASEIDIERVRLPIVIERCNGSPFGCEHEAIVAARAFADTCWRGGVSGVGIYDEILCPQVMSPIMHKHELAGALLVGPEWPLVNVTSEGGCDDVIRHFRGQPDRHNLVFTQAPPGLCGCVISAKLMAEFADRNRLTTIGSILSYQPHAPLPDPIAMEPNVQIDHRIRRSMVRAVADSRRAYEVFAQLDRTDDPVAIVEMLESKMNLTPAPLPQHLVLELTTKRVSNGVFARLPGGSIERPDMQLNVATQIISQSAASDEAVLTLAGIGDPLLHPMCAEIIQHAKAVGIRAVHVRTELLCGHSTIRRIVEAGADIVSVDLHADSVETYQMMMGSDRFEEALRNIEHLAECRRMLTAHTGTAGIALPWIVPRLQRRTETYEDINTFYDRWQHALGTAVIESPPEFADSPECPADTLVPAVTPKRVVMHMLRRRMTILADGSVPMSELDVHGRETIGNIAEKLAELWRRLNAERRSILAEHGDDHAAFKVFRP